MGSQQRTIYFDGICNLCNGWVDFVARRDLRHEFTFEPLGPDAGQSVLLMEGETLYRGSTAVLRVLKELKAPWPVFYYLFIWIPPLIRDGIYRWVAANRYRWFGRRQICRSASSILSVSSLDKGSVREP